MKTDTVLAGISVDRRLAVEGISRRCVASLWEQRRDYKTRSFGQCRPRCSSPFVLGCSFFPGFFFLVYPGEYSAKVSPKLNIDSSCFRTILTLSWMKLL